MMHILFECLTVKGTAIHTGLDRPLGLQEVEAPRISRTSAHKGDNTVSLRNGPFYSQNISLPLISI